MNNTSQTVECVACGWQGARHQTDSGHCPECDGQCFELALIYGQKAADGQPGSEG